MCMVIYFQRLFCFILVKMFRILTGMFFATIAKYKIHTHQDSGSPGSSHSEPCPQIAVPSGWHMVLQGWNLPGPQLSGTFQNFTHCPGTAQKSFWASGMPLNSTYRKPEVPSSKKAFHMLWDTMQCLVIQYHMAPGSNARNATALNWICSGTPCSASSSSTMWLLALIPGMPLHWTEFHLSQ